MTNLEDLEKLHDLKEKGVISEADFEAKKAQLLQEVGNAKSQLAYCLLAFFLGIFGIHNFYVGRWKRGLAQLLLTLLTLFMGVLVTHLWAVINIFAIHTDGKGKEFEPCKTAKYICGILGILGYLWTLLTVFVMAVGGVAGYSMAMSKYQANELENYLSMVSIKAMTENGGEGLKDTVDCQNLLLAQPELVIGKCVAYPGGQIVLSGVSEEVKRNLLQRRRMQQDGQGNIVYSF